MKAGLTGDAAFAEDVATSGRGGFAGFMPLGSCMGTPSCEAEELDAEGRDGSRATATSTAGGGGLRCPLLVERTTARERGLTGSTGGRIGAGLYTPLGSSNGLARAGRLVSACAWIAIP